MGSLLPRKKHYIKADVFVDDRNNMLNNMGYENKECILFKMKTSYTQETIELHNHITTIGNWKAIGNILLC